MNLVKLSKYFIFISFLIIATSCETTDVEEKVIKPEPVPKIIYTPEVEETVEENDEIVEYFKGVELFLNKSLNDLILKYGKVDFSKSNTSLEDCKEYYFKDEDNMKKIWVIVKNCKNIAEIYDYNISEK